MATAYPGGLRKRGGLLDEFMAPDYSYLARRADLTPKQREYAANAPIDFLRGTFAGLLGTPADVANIPQSPMPMEQFGEYSYAPAQKIPYGSEYFLKNLPLAPAEDNPLGRVAGQVGSFFPMVPVQAARMAGKGAMAVGRAGERLAERVVPQVMERGGLLSEMVDAMGQGTRRQMMSIPNGLTYKEQANLIQSQAENFAAKAKEMGLSASVEHSGSKAGPSSYVSISDPITGKKFESPFRFSGHSKGPTQNQFVYDVGNDFSKELNLLENMASSIPKAERDAIQSARQAKMLEELALAEKERLFSQGRPAVQKAMQEAKLQQRPYTKAFSNSGNYLGGLLAP